MEQPKDYEVISFEEMLEQEYQSLTVFQKLVYHLQDYVLVYIVAAFAAGYLAGFLVNS